MRTRTLWFASIWIQRVCLRYLIVFRDPLRVANLELLSMLTAHGIDPLKPMGGLPNITQMDVAGMLRHCSPCESALLRAKYCGDSDSAAWAYWFVYLMDQGWQTERDGIVSALSRSTLDEHIGGLVCKSCHGVGEFQVDHKTLQCESCEGMGRRHWSNREIARRLGLSRLKTPWLERVEWCRAELRAWEYRAVSHMQ